MFSFIISGLAYVVAVDYRMQVAVIVQALFVGPGTKLWWKQHQKLKLHPKQQQVQIWQNRILHTTIQVRSKTLRWRFLTLYSTRATQIILRRGLTLNQGLVSTWLIKFFFFRKLSFFLNCSSLEPRRDIHLIPDTFTSQTQVPPDSQ